MSSDVKGAIRSGLSKGLFSGWFIVKITVPISLLVSCLDYWGVITWAASFFKPLMKLFGMPGEAVFPLISAALLNIYSAIATMTSLPGVFTLKDLNIMAVMCLIAHNLLIETAIQKRCGMKATTIIFTRIFSAVIAGLAMHLLISDPGPPMHFTAAAARVEQTFGSFLLHWGQGVALLVVKILAIVITLMVLYEILHHYRLIQRFSRAIAPVMRLLALSPDSAFIWIASTFVGLGYGGGIIIPEVDKGVIPRDEVARLNLSMAISHSWIEDTLLFFVIGGQLFWLMAPRILLSIGAIHAYNLARRWSERRR